jgi:hypothetical protein
MQEFLRRSAVSENAGWLTAASQRGRAVAEHHANRGTVAKKVGRLTAAKKTTPVRRLTVNRKPLRTPGSLAQPPTSGNGLYSTAGHLVASDRLPHGRRASRQESRGLPCLTIGTTSSLSPPIPFNT